MVSAKMTREVPSKAYIVIVVVIAVLYIRQSLLLSRDLPLCEVGTD